MGWLDVIKNDFLASIQESFPLTPHPFAYLGDRFGVSEHEAIDLYESLKTARVIRQTSAILDTKQLGYQSSLVAFSLDKKDLSPAAEMVNSHPGVSHNYERSHHYNLWFTLAVPPNSTLGLEQTVKLLAKQTGAQAFMMLPTLKMFKIAVKLDTTKTKPLKSSHSQKKQNTLLLTPLHYRVIELIQDDLPAESEPFLPIITKLGITYDHFFTLMEELQQGGAMRRYATILNHRQAGFTANAMVVWDIPDEHALHAGEVAAQFNAVSHCYLRPRHEGWNYNLFTMIHATSSDELSRMIELMQEELNASDVRPLHSLYEYKKVRIRYFTSSTYDWEVAMTKSVS